MRGFLHTLLGKCEHAGKVKLLRGFRLRYSNVAGELAGRKPDRNGDVPQRYERSHPSGFRWFCWAFVLSAFANKAPHMQGLFWSEREDLNLRPLVSQFDFPAFQSLPTIGSRRKNMKNQSLIFPYVGQTMLRFHLRWRLGGDSKGNHAEPQTWTTNPCSDS